MARAAAEALQVEVVVCPAPGQAHRVLLRLNAGATLGDALRASGLEADGAPVGIWGRVQPLQTVLRDRDRVEIYRPLKVDPKEARRLRYKRAKQAGG